MLFAASHHLIREMSAKRKNTCDSLWNCAGSEDVSWVGGPSYVACDAFVFTQQRDGTTCVKTYWGHIWVCFHTYLICVVCGWMLIRIPGLNWVWVYCLIHSETAACCWKQGLIWAAELVPMFLCHYVSFINYLYYYKLISASFNFLQHQLHV